MNHLVMLPQLEAVYKRVSRFVDDVVVRVRLRVYTSQNVNKKQLDPQDRVVTVHLFVQNVA